MTHQDLHEAIDLTASLFVRAVEANEWSKASERAGWWFALALLESETARQEAADA